MNLLNKLFKSLSAPQVEILNTGVAMAMEFGSNWLKPINDRLLKKYPNLTNQEVEQYNLFCQALLDDANKYTFQRLIKLHKLGERVTRRALQEEFKSKLKSEFDWLNEDNLNQLFSQSCYYAYKEGLDKIIIG